MGFIETIKDAPLEAIGDDASQPLILTKEYLDSLIANYKEIDPERNLAIDELTVEGLDANQVWWQTKMVIDNIEGDLMSKIQEFREATQPAYGSDSSEEEIDEAESDVDDLAKSVISEDIEQSASEEDEEDDQEQPQIADEDAESDEMEVVEGKDDYIDSGIEDEVEQDDEEEEEEEEEDANNLNDRFFDIEEFNRQTLAQENNLDEDENNNDSEEIDYFADMPSEEEEEADYYEDFFDKPKSAKKASGSKHKSGEDGEGASDEDEEDQGSALNSMKLDLFEEASDEEDDADVGEDENGKKLSTFEKQQLEIQKQIAQLEAEAVAEKKWALKGEVKAKDRPEDALLAEDLEFERTAKPVPVITTDVTESLEEMIRKRIKEFNFDDLQRKTINDYTKRGPREHIEISDQKSAKSLADIYAEDYQGGNEESAVSEELQKSHDEITELFTNLTYKLDALSSAHFVPRPAQKSLEVRVETSAIAMEDAQPLSMSSGSTLAPQEVYKVGKADNTNEIRLKNGTVMSRDELSREDKTRLRRAAKRKRAKNLAKQPPKKKNKKDDVIETLARAKNITVIDKAGQKHDVKGKSKSKGNANDVTNFRL